MHAIVEQVKARAAKPVGIRCPLHALDLKLEACLNQSEVHHGGEPAHRLRVAHQSQPWIRRFDVGFIAPRRRGIVTRPHEDREQTPVV